MVKQPFAESYDPAPNMTRTGHTAAGDGFLRSTEQRGGGHLAIQAPSRVAWAAGRWNLTDTRTDGGYWTDIGGRGP